MRRRHPQPEFKTGQGRLLRFGRRGRRVRLGERHGWDGRAVDGLPERFLMRVGGRERIRHGGLLYCLDYHAEGLIKQTPGLSPVVLNAASFGDVRGEASVDGDTPLSCQFPSSWRKAQYS